MFQKVEIMTIQTGFPIYWLHTQKISGKCYKRQKDPFLCSPTSFCLEDCGRERKSGLDNKEKNVAVQEYDSSLLSANRFPI